MLIFELLYAIPILSIQTYNRVSWPKYAKYIKWPILLFFMLILFVHALVLALPYRSALERLAYGKYKETTMYRERLVEFGEDFTKELYILNDRRFFLDKLTWKDKLKAIVIPYSC